MSQPRIQFTERNYEAALNVPAQIARDPSVPIADRLRASKILQDLIKIIWEDELYTQDLANLAPQSKRPVIFVREDLESQIESYQQYQREQEALEQAEQQQNQQGNAEPQKPEQQPPTDRPAENSANQVVANAQFSNPAVPNTQVSNPAVPNTQVSNPAVRNAPYLAEPSPSTPGSRAPAQNEPRPTTAGPNVQSEGRSTPTQTVTTTQRPNPPP